MIFMEKILLSQDIIKCLIIKTIPNKGEVNRGIIIVNNSKVLGLKELLNISKSKNPELMNSLSNVNFIGLQYDVLIKLNEILIKFKQENLNDPKIECLLPDNLNYNYHNNLFQNL